MPHGTASYGTVIRKARLAKGIPLKELADATGLSSTFLSRLERGERRELTLSNAIAICDALGLSIDLLARQPQLKHK